MNEKLFRRSCLFLLSALFLFNNAGFVTRELSLATGIALVAALFVTYLPLKAEKHSVLLMSAGIALMAGAVALMVLSEYTRPGALALFMLALGLFLKGSGKEAPELQLFAIVAAGFGVFLLLYRSNVDFFRAVTALSLTFSRLVALLTFWLPGPKALLGPSVLGVGVIFVVLLFFVIGSIMLTDNRRRKLAAAFISTLAVTFLYVVIYSYLPQALDFELKIGPVPSGAERAAVRQAVQARRDHPRTESEKETEVIFDGASLLRRGAPFWTPKLLMAMLLVPVWFFLKDAKLQLLPAFGCRYLAGAGVLLLLATTLIETKPLRAPRGEELNRQIAQKRVAFYNHGFMNWSRPNFQNFGSRSGGMFGMLPDFVEAMGFNQPVTQTRDHAGYVEAGVILPEITRASLADVDILMLANLNGFFNYAPLRTFHNVPEPVAAAQRLHDELLEQMNGVEQQVEYINSLHEETIGVIEEFVRRGGSLLVIGDHTFIKDAALPGDRVESRLWLNDALRPFDIKFANDSAQFLIPGWMHMMRNPLHALNWGIRDDQNETGMVVGASLDIRGRARPVLVGDLGFLDYADMRGSGHLGNLRYDTGEQIGECVLAASQNYGKGRVLVFGDTSAFANTILINSGRFVSRAFAFLAADGVTGSASLPLAIISALIVAASVICFAFARGHAGPVVAALAAGLLVSAHGESLTVPLGPGRDRTRQDTAAIRLALFDDYHLPRSARESAQPDGITGIYLNLMRNGFKVQSLKSFEPAVIERAELLVIAAPSRPFSRRDVDTLVDYVYEGGTVLMTSGYEDLYATRRLLDAFGLEIEHTPLGRFEPVGPGRVPVQFWSVWPVNAVEPALPETLAGELGEMQAIITWTPREGERTYNVAVKREFGKGRFILIADSEIWFNRNLERENHTNTPETMKNINHMRWLLERYVPRRTGKSDSVEVGRGETF